MKLRHVIWDWNGTLLDDVADAVAALNSMLAKRGFPPVSRRFYRANFRFPSRDFYAQLGVNLATEDWGKICDDFHGAFAAASSRRLRSGARAALERFRRAGAKQYLLSAHREDLLRQDALDAGIARFFDEIAGTDNLDGASKEARAKRLFAERLANADPAECLFIGDTLHDAEVARMFSVPCLLLASGHQTRRRLAAAGVPLIGNFAGLWRVLRAQGAALAPPAWDACGNSCS